MNLYKKIIPIAIVLGILGGCNQYSTKPLEERKIYEKFNNEIFEENCDKKYAEGPFFEDIPCGDDIFPRRGNDDWIEDR